ncbi:amino acid permease-associated region (plasmid) [Rhodococcus opacus]|uniref:Amino acid permease-associated region n=1 Tax=Rhodococcus opacus TaxID=37919 RepID=A0A1B1KH30_RHOOP|nr:APC family permease [Rhodococcus opacus]ANS31899.1 amino acid permease-associated region [Rhodococcus opacus]
MSSGPPAAEAVPLPAIPTPSGLDGNVGTLHLFFTVLAFNAPLAIAVGFIPVVVSYGNGVGAPVAYLAAGLLIFLFAIGFTTMSRYMPNPGGFYAYISAGLGRITGLGASFLALLCYYFMIIASYAFGGLVLESLVRDTLHGPDVSWWVWVLVLGVVVSTLGYFKLDLSARVLTIALIAELCLVLVYDAAVVFQGGAEGLGTQSFTPAAASSGSVGIALLFGLTCFGGFEATVIFRDEVQSPERTIPRAAYLVVAAVTGLYVLTTWVFVQAYGPSAVIEAAGADPTGSFLGSVENYVGRVVVDLVTVLLVTSTFAAILAGHNVMSRYVYNLSLDRVLPNVLSKVHGRHGSPYRASIAVAVLSLTGVALLVLFSADPATLYAVLFGMFGYTLIVLLLLTSIAIPVYFRRNSISVSRWKSTVAPALAFIGLCVATGLATQNLDLLIGGAMIRTCGSREGVPSRMMIWKVSEF